MCIQLFLVTKLFVYFTSELLTSKKPFSAVVDKTISRVFINEKNCLDFFLPKMLSVYNYSYLRKNFDAIFYLLNFTPKEPKVNCGIKLCV